MSPGTAVVRTAEVAVDPATAFDVFTKEIGAWYKPGPYSWNHPDRAVGIRFEPGVGGRLMEIWDEETGEGFEMGLIQVWEPGVRLVLAYRSAFLPPDLPTELVVRFESIDGGTRVTLEHRGLDRLPPSDFRTWEKRAWVAFMQWFEDHVRSLDGKGSD